MAKDLQRLREQGDRIRKARLDLPRPHTQEVLADKVGITLRGYQAWEGGESDVSDENLPKLAVALKVSEDYITGREVPAQPDASQLDRIEAKLDELLSRSAPGPAEAIERELDEAVRQARAPAASSGSSARGPRRQHRAS